LGRYSVAPLERDGASVTLNSAPPFQLIVLSLKAIWNSRASRGFGYTMNRSRLWPEMWFAFPVRG
jgi:hypothetical protein